MLQGNPTMQGYLDDMITIEDYEGHICKTSRQKWYTMTFKHKTTKISSLNLMLYIMMTLLMDKTYPWIQRKFKHTIPESHKMYHS